MMLPSLSPLSAVLLTSIPDAAIEVNGASLDWIGPGVLANLMLGGIDSSHFVYECLEEKGFLNF
jgi:hypothetical protein